MTQIGNSFGSTISGRLAVAQLSAEHAWVQSIRLYAETNLLDRDAQESSRYGTAVQYSLHRSVRRSCRATGVITATHD
jgi:hypothetical protein